MKLFLLTLVGLVAMAAAQEGEFVLIDDEVEKNDVDPDSLERLEKDGTVSRVLSELLNQTSASSARSLPASCVNDRPAVFGDLAKSRVAKGSLSLFDGNSGNNQALQDPLPLSRGKRRGLLPNFAAATNTTTPSPLKRAFWYPQPTRYYYCPHRTYLLRWFALFSCSTVIEVCFVPYASNQNITYAKCIQNGCLLNYNRKGRCRPNCYTRRRIYATCYNIRTGQWRWKWVVRKLPQACTCSTC